MSENIVPLNQLGMNDVPRVGGKNASLGEMISNLGSLGVEVPGGFALLMIFWTRPVFVTGFMQNSISLITMMSNNLPRLARK
jgi:phosphoenolpyruvate synthase/pyruvate phosphate dikinase